MVYKEWVHSLGISLRYIKNGYTTVYKEGIHSLGISLRYIKNGYTVLGSVCGM